MSPKDKHKKLPPIFDKVSVIETNKESTQESGTTVISANGKKKEMFTRSSANPLSSASRSADEKERATVWATARRSREK